MGQYKWAIFDDDRKALLSTLRKCISDFHWILVTKLSSILIIFLSSEENIQSYGPSFNRYSTFECGSVQITIKNRSYAHIKARLCPPLSVFWSDQLLDHLPAVCLTDLTPNCNAISTSQNPRGKYGAWKWCKVKSVFCKDQSLMYSRNFSTWLVDA